MKKRKQKSKDLILERQKLYGEADDFFANYDPEYNEVQERICLLECIIDELEKYELKEDFV